MTSIKEKDKKDYVYNPTEEELKKELKLLEETKHKIKDKKSLRNVEEIIKINMKAY